jgi:KUP system potassium uptake protein
MVPGQTPAKASGPAALAALGAAYGTIGTSPLYAFRAVFTKPYGAAVAPEEVLGALSLFTWALVLVIGAKYLAFVIRADNQGEGGTLALLTALDPRKLIRLRGGILFVLVGLLDAALLAGDGAMTPAISVLSAVEGLNINNRAHQGLVVLLALIILVALFAVQRRMTGKTAPLLGRAMLVWFVAIAAIGAPWIVRQPQVLYGLNPLLAVSFVNEHRAHGFIVVSAVLLCVAGAEALYAGMGNVGRRHVRVAGLAIACPALLINYFGQGARLLAGGSADEAFFGLVPGVLRIPLVVVAVAAALAASQAVITGALSLTRQAVQLGYFPRVTIVHTNEKAPNEIYIPEVNWALMVAGSASSPRSNDRPASPRPTGSPRSAR